MGEICVTVMVKIVISKGIEKFAYGVALKGVVYASVRIFRKFLLILLRTLRPSFRDSKVRLRRTRFSDRVTLSR